MAYLIAAYTDSRTANDHPCWRSDYLHRFLVLVATLAAGLKNKGEDPDTTSHGLGDYLRHTAFACAAVNPTATVKLGGERCDELVGILVSFVSNGVGIEGDAGEVD